MSTSEALESANPSFVMKDLEIQQEQTPAPRQTTRKLLAIGFSLLVCGAAIGTAATYALLPRGPSASADTVQASPESTISSAIAKEPRLAQLTTAQIEELVDEYEQSSSWNNAFVPEQFVQSISLLRADTQGRARADDEDLQILEKYDEELAEFAFRLVDDASEGVNGGFVDPIVFENDVISVSVRDDLGRGKQCFVMAKGTDSASDWTDNLNLSKTDILSLNTEVRADERCGCARSQFFYCAEFSSCAARARLGVGNAGIVNPWNNLYSQVWAQIQSKCLAVGADDVVMTGHSRGGALVSVGALAMEKEGLLSPNQITVVSFASPRTLDEATADEAQGRFTSYRLVYKNDIVPSLPYGWQGFKHFGSLVCYQCSYTAEVDSPGFIGIGGAFSHSRANYRNWLGA